MSLAVAVDAVILFGVVLATWSGWRAGAARKIVSTIAAVAGIFLAAQGRGPLAEVISQLLPGADDVLISLLILVGASWVLLGLLSWLIGTCFAACSTPFDSALLTIFLVRSSGLCKGSCSSAS